MRKLTVLSICVVLVFGLSFTSSAIASDEDEILEIVTTAYKAMNTLDYELMSSVWLHSPKTSAYFPSGDPFIYNGWEIVGNTWKSYFSASQSSKEPTTTYPHNYQVTMLSDNLAILTGYDSNLVRVTLVVQKVSGKWLIVHQHTSVLPTE